MGTSELCLGGANTINVKDWEAVYVHPNYSENLDKNIDVAQVRNLFAPALLARRY